MKQVNGLPVYEEDDACSLDEYSEEMAQKVHNKIEESKYNDANIKKDIADLKKEQEEQNENMTDLEKYNTNQDKLITKLQEENNKLKKALINVETEEEKNIHIEDANQIGSLEVLGNNEQAIRSGKNKFIQLPTGNNSGIAITMNTDGTYNISGTAIANIEHTAFIDLDESEIENGLTYTLSSTKALSEGLSCRAEMYNGTSWLRAFVPSITSTNETSTGTANTSNATRIRFGIFITKGTTLDVKNIGFQLEEGEIATNYEQYGASPSPDYPSEVKCLGSNKNIFDEVLLTGYGYNQSTGLKTQNVSTYCNDNIIEVNTNNVTFSQNGEDKLGRFFCYDINKTFLGSVVGTGTIELLENTRFINFQTTKETLNYNPVNVKIEEGTEVTSYSPSGQGSTKIIADDGIHDLEVVQGSLNSSTGTIINTDTRLRTADFIEINDFDKIDCEEVTTCNVFFYDKNKAFLERASSNWENLPFQFQIPQNAVYLKAIFRKDDKTLTPDMIKNLRIYKEEMKKVLYIQQEMLKGDYFVKEDDVWREVHNWNKLILKGTEYINISSLKDTRMVLLISNAKQDTEEILAVSNSFLGITYNEQQSNNLTNVIAVNNSYLLVDTENITSTSEFKALLQEKYNAGNPVYVYYKTATPIKLPCTEEQVAVLEELNNLNLFEGVNNIITAEDIALLKLKYVADTKMYLENYINSKIAESEN